MNTENLYRRQLDIIPLDRLQKASITVIGAGAVGSFTAFTLAKMGVGKITVFDHDTVTEHNLPNQMYSIADCGKSKAEALRDMVEYFHGVEINPISRKYTDQALSGIVIVAVDSMDVRIKIWEQLKYNSAAALFIDSRMGAEVGRVITIHPADPDDVAKYESTLHTSGEALPERCTEKSIIYTVLGIASAICGKVKKHLVSDPYRKDIAQDFRQGIILPL